MCIYIYVYPCSSIPVINDDQIRSVGLKIPIATCLATDYWEVDHFKSYDTAEAVSLQNLLSSGPSKLPKSIATP